MKKTTLTYNAVIVSDDDRILIARCNAEDKWVLPNGKLRSGETLPQAIKRIAFDEVGLAVKVIRSLDKNSSFYECRLSTNDSPILPPKYCEYRWANLGEFVRMTYAFLDRKKAMKEIIAKLFPYGYLRETQAQADKAGIDSETKLCRTGLDSYLNVIFPGETWAHNTKMTGGICSKLLRYSPDYRCDKLHLIVEFDGMDHYQSAYNVKADEEKTKCYEANGWKVVRIPYFIQLTNDAVWRLFGRRVKKKLFPQGVASISVSGKNTPAFLCVAGAKRMVDELKKFPQQLEANIKRLKKDNNEFLTDLQMFDENFQWPSGMTF